MLVLSLVALGDNSCIKRLPWLGYGKHVTFLVEQRSRKLPGFATARIIDVSNTGTVTVQFPDGGYRPLTTYEIGTIKIESQTRAR